MIDQLKDDASFFLGLVAGGIVGGIVAALLVPPSGSELRAQLPERGLALTNPSEEAVQRAQQIAQQTVADMQQPDRGPTIYG